MASCPNVTMKLGGLAMLAAGFGFHERARPPSSTELAAAWRPYFEAAIEAFGPTRCMFESNFSVDKGMAGYAALWNAFKRVAAGASADEKRALVDMLRAGDIDAAILGNDLPDDPDLGPVIVHPVEAAAAWYAKYHVVPTNHVMVVRTDVAEADPEAIRALWRCLLRAKPAPRNGVDFAATGIEAHRGPIEMLLRFCDQQALLPRALTFDEIYAPAKKLLGDLLAD